MEGKLSTICGETGSGKSALIRHTLRHSPQFGRRKFVIADATEWSLWWNEVAETGHSPFHAKSGLVELLVCENLQRLHDPLENGDRLAGLLDHARHEQVAVIVTAEYLPSQIPDLSPRLLNRLHGGLLTSIRPLSRESQIRLWNHWSTQPCHATVPKKSMFNSLMTTAGELRQLWETSIKSPGRSSSHPTLERDIVSLDALAELVALEFQVSITELRSGSRAHGLKVPRGVAMTLARELTQQPLTCISRYFGCRSHTSVTRSCSRLQQLLPDAPSLRQQIAQLRAKLCRKLSADCG